MSWRYGSVLYYLKASRHEIGLLLNFGGPSLEYKRFIWSPNAKEAAHMETGQRAG